MPSKTITTTGTTPILASNAARVGILATNDTAYPIYWRQMGAVTATSGLTKGHIIRPNGGSIMLTGFAAKQPLYACVPVGQPSVELTTEEYF